MAVLYLGKADDQLNATNWKHSFATSGGGAGSFDGSLKKSGSHSFKVDCSSGGSDQCALNTRLLRPNGNATAFSSPSLYAGAWVYIGTLPASAYETLIYFDVTSTFGGAGDFRVVVLSTGQLQVHQSSSGLIGSVGSSVLGAGWVFVEANLNIVGGGGTGADTYEVRVSGVTELSGSGNFSSAGGIPQEAAFGKLGNLNSQSVVYNFDSPYVSDSAFLGPGNCHVVVPTGNSATNTGWTATAGNKWECIDELPPSDSDAITSGTSAGNQIYSATHASAATLGIGSQIVAVEVAARVREVSSTSTQGGIGIRSGSNTLETAADWGSTTVVSRGVRYETDPNTSVAWTVAGLDAAEPLVYRSSADTSNIRCSGLLMYVWSAIAQVTPAAADLEVEGFAPNLSIQVTPATAELETEGFAPTVVIGKQVSPAASDMEVEGFAPSLTLRVTPAAGELEVEGFAPDVGVGRLVTPEAAQLEIEGFAPELILGRSHRSQGVRLNVFEPDGTTPVGIVTHVLTASYGQDVNSIGSWSVSVPADSPQAAYLGDRYRVQIHIGGEGYVFQGIVTKRQTRVTGETKVLEVSGWSTARELVDRDTGQGFQLESETLTDAYDALLAIEGNWTTGTIGSPALAVWSRRFDGVKLWQGLVKLADMFGVLFREDSRTRTIDAGAFGDDSGLTFKNWQGPVPADLHLRNPGLVLLNGIDVAVETQEIVTRVEPRGQRQGISGDDTTLEHATDTTLYTTQSGTRNGLDYWYLVDAAAESALERVDATIRVSDVLPLGLDPATDLIRAANALHGVAATWLSRRSVKLRSYQLPVEGLRHIVDGVDTFKVGQKARVVYQGASKTLSGDVIWLDLDEDLWIMGYRRTVLADGRSSWTLKVSNVTREVPDSTTKLAEMYEQFEASLTAPWPMLTWGGTPPVGRLTPLGGQLVSLSGYLAAEPTRKWQWTTSDFQTVFAELYGARDESFDTNYMISKVFKDVDAYHIAGIAEEDDSDWDIAAWTAQSDGGTPTKWGIQKASTPLFSLIRVDDNNYTLWVRKDGALVEVGGGMYPPSTLFELLTNGDGAFCRFGDSGGVPSYMFASVSGPSSALDATEGVYHDFEGGDDATGGSSFIHYEGPFGKAPSTRVVQEEWANVSTVSLKWRGAFPDNSDYETRGVGFGADFATTNAHHAWFGRNSGNWQLGTGDGSTTTESTGGTADGNWHDFEIQWDANQVRAYVDGSLVITKTTNRPSGRHALRIDAISGSLNIFVSTMTVTWT